MIFSKGRKIRRLAKEYGMPESDIRQMIAIEAGATDGDMRDVREGGPQAPSDGWFQKVLARFSAASFSFRPRNHA